MNDTAKTGFRAAIAVIAPAVLTAGLLYHPHIHDLTDPAAVAAAAQQGAFRWGLAHLLVGVGAGLMALAFLAVRSWLREVGEDRWSAAALPFIIIGSTLYAFLPGMEFSVLAAVETGADASAIQAAIDPWFLPVLFAAAVLSALGALGFARAIALAGMSEPAAKWLVVLALIVMAAARFVPIGFVQFHVQSAAAIVALWVLAYEIWRRPSPHSEHAPTVQTA